MCFLFSGIQYDFGYDSKPYLGEWLKAINYQSECGKKYNSSMKVRIEKLLKEHDPKST